MSNKCEFCNEKIEEDERGKIVGTIIKIKSEEEKGKNEYKYVCSNCQKEGKDKELKKGKK